MALTKAIQAVFEGSPVSGTYQPVKSEVTTLITELTDGSLPLFTLGGSVTHTAGTLALAFGTQNHVIVTPNAAGAFTSTVPAAGTVCTLKVLTSGVTSYAMTFGSGFKSQGTLNTGTVTSKVFILSFVSDGTTLNEISRTAAM